MAWPEEGKGVGKMEQCEVRWEALRGHCQLVLIYVHFLCRLCIIIPHTVI